MSAATISLERNLEEVRARIAGAARGAGRDPSEVTLVAVGKTFGLDALVAAIEAGATDLGENRAQEFRDKFAALGPRVRWHFVGHLQTNKVRNVVGNAALIHSLDRPALAEAVARRARTLGIVQDVLIEVNLGGERSKHGVEPGRALDLAVSAAELQGVSVRGLMAIPPMDPDPEAARPHFRKLSEMSAQLTERLPDARDLSMGMSHDLEVAVQEGATIVRVGEAIFGPRS